MPLSLKGQIALSVQDLWERPPVQCNFLGPPVCQTQFHWINAIQFCDCDALAVSELSRILAILTHFGYFMYNFDQCVGMWNRYKEYDRCVN